MLATWGVDRNYCYECRFQHAERRSIPACERPSKKFMSRVEAIEKNSTENQIQVESEYCSVIQDKPVDLLQSNRIAYEVIELTYGISPKIKYEFSKNESTYWTYIHTLDNMIDAINILFPEGIEQNELLLLIKKVNLIHSYNIGNIR